MFKKLITAETPLMTPKPNFTGIENFFPAKDLTIDLERFKRASVESKAKGVGWLFRYYSADKSDYLEIQRLYQILLPQVEEKGRNFLIETFLERMESFRPITRDILNFCESIYELSTSPFKTETEYDFAIQYLFDIRKHFEQDNPGEKYNKPPKIERAGKNKPAKPDAKTANAPGHVPHRGRRVG